MKRLLKVIGIGAIGLAAATGCIIPKMSHGKIKGWYVIPVVIPVGHVHTAYCGHYQRGSDWYIVENHTHCAGCGHSYRGGAWIEVD